MLTIQKLSRRAFGKRLAAVGVCTQLPAGVTALAEPSTPATPVQSQAITYLMADEAQRSPSLTAKVEPGKEGVKRFWIEDWRTPQQFFEWTVLAEQAGNYEVTLMVSAPAGSKLVVQGAHGRLLCQTTQPEAGGYNWDRITLPSTLPLPQGSSTIRVKLVDSVTGPSSGAALKSIELLNIQQRKPLDARIRAFRSDTTWLREAKFGLMTQCGEWSYPPHGPQKPWPAFAENFDVERFAALVDSTGAGYAVWSATWATYYFPAPIRAIDRIMPGRTSNRDLIGDIADALRKRDIRLILYYHPGHDTSPANGAWWSKNWVSQSDKAPFIGRWCSIVEEVGERYGDRLAGWMFDDELLYYPAPYERMGRAAKAGNPARLLSYNAWIQARGTDFQDFQFGEGYMGSPALPVSDQGIWPSGPMKGLQAHGCFQLDGPDWGINHPDIQIQSPTLSREQAKRIALDAALRGEALSWNLLMYDDGSVSPESLSLLQEVGHEVRRQYPRKKI